MSKTNTIATLVALALFGAGCSHPLLATPPRFLELEQERGAFDYRATSADGVVIGARKLDYDRERGGGVDFWTDAVKQRLSQMGGYQLLEEKAVKTSRGLEGKQLRFGHDEKNAPFQYWVALFVEGDELFVVEAGGPEEKLKAHEASVDKAIASLDP
jgi:hypothetical protein